jgi:hypothetical protein
VPAGCPLALLPLLVIIEFISYLSRSISLGLRLSANVLAGHLLLSILSLLTYNIMVAGFFFFLLGLVPLAFIIVFCGLEIIIAFVQAQVFVILTAAYIKDSLFLHSDSSAKVSSASLNRFNKKLNLTQIRSYSTSSYKPEKKYENSYAQKTEILSDNQKNKVYIYV